MRASLPTVNHLSLFLSLPPSLTLCLPISPSLSFPVSLLALLTPLGDSLAVLTWPLLTLALCYSKLILFIRAQSKAKYVGASLCDNAAGTSELGYKGCLSFPHWTWHGFVLLADVEEQSENSVWNIFLVLLNLEVVMKQSHKHNLYHTASISPSKWITDYWKSKAVRK